MFIGFKSLQPCLKENQGQTVYWSEVIDKLGKRETTIVKRVKVANTKTDTVFVTLLSYKLFLLSYKTREQ